MIARLFKPLKSNSFFLFGARGVGKSTWLSTHFTGPDIMWIDLLDPTVENRYALNPERLVQEIDSRPSPPNWIVIDEIQKVPKLLDLVHLLIEKRKLKFAMSGSSARKLKRGAANLLAGRAFVYHLYPISLLELNNVFSLEQILHWGCLPKSIALTSDREKKAFLNAYVQTYFAEEIRTEQLIRNLDPFRAFLPILGQVSGKIINHKKIATEIGVSSLTVQSYFQIVEDTLLGYYLPAFHLSVRKSQRQSPKFYLIDTGIKKALDQSLDQVPAERTSVFGELFETLVINEIVKLNSYFEKDFRLSYYATKNIEVDLILSKGKKNIAIEIKSNSRIVDNEVRQLARNTSEIPNLERVFYLSQDPQSLKIENVECITWLQFLNNFKNL